MRVRLSNIWFCKKKRSHSCEHSIFFYHIYEQNSKSPLPKLLLQTHNELVLYPPKIFTAGTGGSVYLYDSDTGKRLHAILTEAAEISTSWWRRASFPQTFVRRHDSGAWSHTLLQEPFGIQLLLFLFSSLFQSHTLFLNPFFISAVSTIGRGDCPPRTNNQSHELITE